LETSALTGALGFASHPGKDRGATKDSKLGSFSEF